MTHGPASDALRLMAARAPGQYVEGWTDRPTVPLDLRPVWDSFCAFAGWGETSPTAVIDWVRVHHWRESPAGVCLLVDVFLALLAERSALTSKPPPQEPSDD